MPFAAAGEMTPPLSLSEMFIDTSDAENGIRQLMAKIKPDWRQNDIHVQILTGGYSCALYQCFPKSNEDDSVVIRVTGVLTGSSVYHRPEVELKVLREVSKRGYFPRLYAEFKNGYCYEYVKGRSILNADSTRIFMDEKLVRSVGRKLAGVHSVVVPEVDYSPKEIFGLQIKSLIQQYKCRFTDSPSQEEMIDEFKFLDEICGQVESPFVQAHGDFHQSNIVQVDGNDELMVMDWEATDIGPRALDIAYFLYIIDNWVEIYQIPKDVPEEDDRVKMFCESYIDQWYEMKKETSSSTEEAVKQLVREVKQFKPASLFLWVLYVVIFDGLAESMSPEGDGNKFFRFVLDKYLDAKRELLGIATLGRK